ncbi:uncharacterized protein CDV56_107511 [Aspergillus thermomutatus]|uniref:Bacteriophage T5 Orf172 DNA-binding domain-containing protein n=1 Tax=Aspergillus thermomutatus TaxID=41047 RepID=A0A397GSF2_ASPTH|nr:uncharacterized protein CDV56_107511 [Aspergillus thermomutatus]RHZ53745.1 hypothetical protein CDV56_107511 [Aspergillus thermomutatus]
MSGDEVQLTPESPSTPTKPPLCQATLDGTRSPLGSASDAGVISSPPSPTDTLFSPTGSTTTDITDDYGWQTPVKGRQALSTTLNTDNLESAQGEENAESGGDEARAGHTQTFKTHSLTKPWGRAKRANSLDLKLSISSLYSENVSKALLSKRKESSTSPVDSSAWVSDHAKFPEGITWPPTQAGQKTSKRSRHTKIEYWTSEQARNISTEFSGEGAWILRPRAASDVGGGRKSDLDPVVSFTQDQCADQTSSSNLIIPSITISPPEDDQIDSAQIMNDQHNPHSKSMPPGDGTIQVALTLLSTQYSSTSAKDQDGIQKSLYKIIPLEIRKRLREDDQHCPAWTTKGLRCRKPHRANVSRVTHLLDTLTAIKPSQVFQCMSDLITVALCSSSHQRVARKELETWRKDIDKLHDIQQDQRHIASHTNQRILALADWMSTLSGAGSFSKKVETPPPPTTKESIPSNIPQVFTLIQKFRPHVTGDSVRLSVSEALEKLLIKPLMDSEIKRVGSVYVYWQPGNFGHLKIGYSKDIGKRITAWSSQCSKPMEVYYPKRGSDEESLQVSHVCRVEKLVHMELKNYRRAEEQCPGCGKRHIEWFEVSRHLATEVVRKWMAWMRTSPYEQRTCGGTTEWVLKDEQRRKLRDLSQPLHDIAISRQNVEKGERKNRYLNDFSSPSPLHPRSLTFYVHETHYILPLQSLSVTRSTYKMEFQSQMAQYSLDDMMIDDASASLDSCMDKHPYDLNATYNEALGCIMPPSPPSTDDISDTESEAATEVVEEIELRRALPSRLEVTFTTPIDGVDPLQRKLSRLTIRTRERVLYFLSLYGIFIQYALYPTEESGIQGVHDALPVVLLVSRENMPVSMWRKGVKRAYEYLVDVEGFPAIEIPVSGQEARSDDGVDERMSRECKVYLAKLVARES